jgi:hypothetical protein
MKEFEYIKKNRNIKYVVMSSPFNQYFGQDAKILTRQGSVVDGQKIAIKAMKETTKQIKELKKTPVIFSPTPQSGENIGNCLKKSVFFNADKSLCEIKLSDSIARQYVVFDFIKNIERDTSVVWLQDFLCTSGICRTSVNDILLYRDQEHLSYEGSAYLGEKMNFYHRLEEASGSNLN